MALKVLQRGILFERSAVDGMVVGLLLEGTSRRLRESCETGPPYLL
jgi:hypothetical protein